MKNIVISGYYGFNNTGDEAMIETMSTLLAKRDCSLTVLSSNPDKTKELYNVRAFNRYKLGEVIKAIKKADLVISGGRNSIPRHYKQKINLVLSWNNSSCSAFP